jgi:hypothetical protein
MTTRFMNGWRRLGLGLVALWILGVIGTAVYERWPALEFDVRTKISVIAAVAVPIVVWGAIEVAYLAVRWVIRAFRGGAP